MSIKNRLALTALGRKLIAVALAGLLAAAPLNAAPLIPAATAPAGQKVGACGLTLVGSDFWQELSAGGKIQRLNDAAGAQLRDILSQAPAGAAESVLAQALKARLGAAAGSEKYRPLFDVSGGRLQLSALGCRALIDQLSAGGGGAPASPAAARNALKPGALGNGVNLAPLQSMARSGTLDQGRSFDGSAAHGSPAEAVASRQWAPGAPANQSASQPRKFRSLGGLNGAAAQAPPAPNPQQASPGKPPNNRKGRIARIAGALGAGAGIGTAACLLWGPAAMAYYVTGSLMKSAQYNSDLLQGISQKVKNSRVVKFLQRSKTLTTIYNEAIKPFGEVLQRSDLVRFLAGMGLFVGGLVTGNPVAAYFGMTFGILGAGEMISTAAFNKTYALLNRPALQEAGRKVALRIDKAVKNIQERLGLDRRGPADNGEVKNPGKVELAVKKALTTIHDNRGKIVKTALATALSIGSMTGFAFGTNYALGATIGQMSPKTGDLSFTDRVKDTLIGAYRLYNMPGTVFKQGKNTQDFYNEMKAKYNPKTPQDWADIVENQITWVSHGELYGTNLYYVSSEEAARLATFNGVVGRYSDCTGKAALLYNMLRMDNFGPSQVVIGSPSLGKIGSEGHAWITTKDPATGKTMELFHYSNTQDLLPTQTASAAEGIKGDRMAAFVAGGVGGLVTKGIYGFLDKIDTTINKIRKKDKEP